MIDIPLFYGGLFNKKELRKMAEEGRDSGRIIYTRVDEAPALATYSLLPIIEAYTKAAGIEMETRNISLAGRTLAKFPDLLNEDQRVSDDLSKLGELVKKPEANIIKLPCISASLPQLKAAVKELQGHGYDIPDYPDEPSNDQEKEWKARFDKIKGSAVNPVLRMGNSDRRAPKSVKNYAKKNPHYMNDWSSDSKAHVTTMSEGDLAHNEIAITVPEEDAGDCRIEFVDDEGNVEVLKEKTTLLKSEIMDASVMSRRKLREFIRNQIQDAKEKDILFSVHLKATMMKVSDPIIFGHVVSVYFEDLFDKYGEKLAKLGVNPNNGLGDLYAKIEDLPDDEKKMIEEDIQAIYDKRPPLAMVDSDRGITNLHVPSDVIIDASMPRAIRDGGKMWNPDGELQTAKFTIPDSSYAGVYQAVIEDCKKNGKLDPTTMGTVQNVGLMAQKAEEYGSHDKTFEMKGKGKVRVVSAAGNLLLERDVEEGDIFRGCQVKDLPVQDWVKLGVNRARATGWPAVFWLNEKRAHDRELISKVKRYLKDHDTEGLDIRIMDPVSATEFSLERMRRGEDTISVTGNVLRDYLTDLFPILEVGTSAKMLSIVPLMAGGGLFETGAGGSAPKHVQQFMKEGHLRWDSLGEFLALVASLEHLSDRYDNKKAMILAKALDKANERYLQENKAPSRKVGEPDNRTSHFYLAMYWAEALSEQDDDPELKERFAQVFDRMKENEDKINKELMDAQGEEVDLGGYYKVDDEKVSRAMRPSATLNSIIDSV